MPGILLEVDGGWFLLDTGFNTPVLLDQLMRRRLVHMGIEDELVGDAGDSIERAFEFVGIDPAEVVNVALSHLHYDQAGCAGWARPIHCQRTELDHALALRARAERDVPRRLRRPPHRLAAGRRRRRARARHPAGAHEGAHDRSPGFVVDLVDGGGFVFAFDAADLTENIEDELAPRSFYEGGEEGAIESIRRLKHLAAEKGAG